MENHDKRTCLGASDRESKRHNIRHHVTSQKQLLLEVGQTSISSKSTNTSVEVCGREGVQGQENMHVNTEKGERMTVTVGISSHAWAYWRKALALLMLRTKGRSGCEVDSVSVTGSSSVSLCQRGGVLVSQGRDVTGRWAPVTLTLATEKQVSEIMTSLRKSDCSIPEIERAWEATMEQNFRYTLQI